MQLLIFFLFPSSIIFQDRRFYFFLVDTLLFEIYYLWTVLIDATGTVFVKDAT
jgi:hypothetical protein